MFNRLPCRTNHPAYFGLTKLLFESTLSAVDGSQGNICARNVNALFRCKPRGTISIRDYEQATELLQSCKSPRRIVLIFHTILHIFVLCLRTEWIRPVFIAGVYCFPPPMSRDTTLESRQEMLRVAARLFQQQGYDATSMNDVAAALKLSKGGLYHHFQSKDEILFDLMNHAMDLTHEQILAPVRRVSDPEARLRLLIKQHVEVVLSAREREITVLLHENHPLPPSLRKQINARKKEYIQFVEELIAQVQQAKGSTRSVSAHAATFALLGMINWLYQWYKPGGPLGPEEIAQQYTEIFFAGAF